MDAEKPAASSSSQDKRVTSSDDAPLPPMEESLLSSEKLDRASPDLWPEAIPGVSEFASMPGRKSPLPWETGMTPEDLGYIAKLGVLSTSELISEVKRLHDLAYQLGLEEAREMTRGKYLNIFQSRKD